MKRPVTLIIMDGYGNGPKTGNAIAAANKPNLDRIFAENPLTQISASGLAVGLPDGQMGNSEVGHTNIGAGRVVYQELTRITKAIADGDFFENETLIAAMENCRKNNSALHIMGLMSDGGVHSHNSHLWAILKLAKQYGLERVYIHALMDGRDVSPTSGYGFIEECIAKAKQIGVGRLATIIGRYYAMDRDNRWERVGRAYAALVYGEGKECPDPLAGMKASYDSEVTDEFIEPLICCPEGRIKANDSVIFFNFRPDRAREITRALVDPDFDAFERKNGFFPLYYVTMTQYDATMPGVHVAFKPQTLRHTFGEYLSELGLTQLRIAETEKYAHVTFFFNGGVETVYPGEERILINSPKVATYDLQPEMSAYEVKDAVVEQIEAGKYDAIVLNFANCDMVGHTGVFDAAVQAVQAVDACVGAVVDAVAKVGGACLITADHGNAETMFDEAGDVITAHSTNPVPLCITGCGALRLREDGKLCDLAPTMLDIMNLEKPAEMTGESIIRKA